MRMQASNIPVTDLGALAAAQQALAAITGGSGRRHLMQYQGLLAFGPCTVSCTLCTTDWGEARALCSIRVVVAMLTACSHVALLSLHMCGLPLIAAASPSSV